MMDAAYFLGRRELLDFFNELLDLNLTKIEQTASGAVACQLTDYIYPGSIPMQRVNWEAKSDYEFIQNYKLLQAAFTKHNVQRHIEVDRLIRAKYQDNLEFCQWLKAFST
jgi:microtubule-associated protein, RP/EB family